MTDWSTIDAGLAGPDFYTGDEFLGPLERLRVEDPVHWTEDHLRGRGFWSLTRYDDCAALLADPHLFSSKAGSQLPPSGAPATPELMYKMGADVRLTQQDPPFHTKVRRPLNPHFSVPSCKRHRDRIEQIVDTLIADIARGGRIDLVEDLTALLPVNVILTLMDLPQDDWPYLRDLAKTIINPNDPKWAKGRDARTVQADGFAELNRYMHADLMKRRKNPGDDFASIIATLDVEGEDLSERYVGWVATTTVAGGLESTRDAGSLGLRAFINNPGQADLLRRDPSLIGQAVEEVLRFSTPSRHRLRVATEDTVIGGQQIAQGDWVVGWLTAANRDPAVFERPNEFDITRTAKRQMAFGAGTHMCLGRNLARIELEMLILKFLQAFRDVEELEPGPEWIGHNNVVAGLKSYPVDLIPAQTSTPAYR